MIELQPEIRTVILGLLAALMAKASALRLRAKVGFSGTEAALGAGIRGHLAPSLFVAASTWRGVTRSSR
jgi:hypothetical protein